MCLPTSSSNDILLEYGMECELMLIPHFKSLFIGRIASLKAWVEKEEPLIKSRDLDIARSQ